MVYISYGWLKNKDNMNYVHDLISDYYATDVVLASGNDKGNVMQKLLDIGETEIAKRFEHGEMI